MKTEIKPLEKNATFEEMFKKIIEVCVANGVPRSFLFGPKKIYKTDQVVCPYCNSPDIEFEETKDYRQNTCRNCEVSWGEGRVNEIKCDNGTVPKNIPEHETPISGPDLRKDYIPNGTNGYLLGKGKCIKCNQDLDFCSDCRNAACKGK